VELAPGETVELDVQGRDGSRWLASRVVRYDQTSGRLTLDWPLEHLRLVAVRAGQPVVVEIARAGEPRYTLPTLVELASTEPEPPRLVLLATGEWQLVERRATPRQAVDIRPVRTARISAEGIPLPVHDVRIVDLGAGGLRLSLREAEIGRGDVLELVLALPDGGGELRLRVDVVRLERNRGAYVEVGCQLRGSRPEDRQRIVNFVLDHA
jgi:PilZ domain-containing protein